jgi:PHD/YefM family antitoxin component YafN of YafNO toxin-antitoxin module
MNSTYSVTEAQRNLPRLLKDAAEKTIAIRRHGDVAAYLVSRERMDAILETLEILGNPAAMNAIRKAEAGKTKFYPLSALNETR